MPSSVASTDALEDFVARLRWVKEAIDRLDDDRDSSNLFDSKAVRANFGPPPGFTTRAPSTLAPGLYVCKAHVGDMSVIVEDVGGEKVAVVIDGGRTEEDFEGWALGGTLVVAEGWAGSREVDSIDLKRVGLHAPACDLHHVSIDVAFLEILLILSGRYVDTLAGERS